MSGYGPGHSSDTVDQIAARFGLPSGGTLTYRGLWDLDAGGRRLNFGTVLPGRSQMPVPFLREINSGWEGAGELAARAILIWLDVAAAEGL